MKINLTTALIALIILGFVATLSGYFLIDYRPKHCLDDKCIDPAVFSKLPKYPKDLNGDLNWKQPEFYPRFEEEGVKYYVNPPLNYLGFYGYGAFPSDVILDVGQNEQIVKTTNFYTSWFVVTYQGLKLIPIIPDNAKDYFEVSIEPENILLEPTFPVFEYNWTQKVTIKVNVKNPPKGEYTIGIGVSEPESRFSDIWFKKYGGRYIAGSIFDIGRPPYQMVLRIQ